jgi:hypothetical protein
MDGLTEITTKTGTGMDDSILRQDVYYKYRESTQSATTTSVNPNKIALTFTEIQNGATGTQESTYIKSQYAPIENIEIAKTYTNTTHTNLYPRDHIETNIRLKNTGKQVIKNTEYLDTLPKIFSGENTLKYKIVRGDTAVSRDFESV